MQLIIVCKINNTNFYKILAYIKKFSLSNSINCNKSLKGELRTNKNFAKLADSIYM